MRLYRYIGWRFVVSVVKVQLSILALVLLLQATAELRFLSELDVSFTKTLWLIIISLPPTLSMTFPLVILLASLFTFQSLSRTSELVIVRASGISALKILLVPIAVTLVVGVFGITVFNPIVATSNRVTADIHVELTGKSGTRTSISSDGLWLRQTMDDVHFIIQARSSNRDGNILFDVRFHEFAPDGNLSRRIESDQAVLNQGSWYIRNARQWILDASVIEGYQFIDFTNITLPTNLTRERILESFATPETLSVWRIPAFIQQLEDSGFSAVRHRVFLQSQISSPLLFVAMVLIGAALSLRHARFGQTGVRALIAVLMGFLLIAMKNVAESLGEAQEVPVVFATWALPIAATLLALAYVLHLEDG